ncbi:MAG TPA: hypothetical protein VIV55_05115 [Flavobacterium sp.]
MKKIIDFVSKHPVVVTALVCVVFYFLPFKPKPFGDGQFHSGTQELIQFILNGFQGNVHIDKGFLTLFCYLIPYSLVYSFHNDHLFYLSSVVFSCAFVCYSVYLIFKTLDIMEFDVKTKFIALIILSIFPIHIYYAMGVIGEVFAFFAVSVFVFTWVKITKLKTDSLMSYVYLALSLVLLYGIKPTMIPFIFAFTVCLLFFKVKLVNKIVFTFIIFLIPILGMIEKNMDNSGFDFKSTIFRNQILWSRFELRDEPFNWLPQHGRDGFESSDYLNNLAKREELDSICNVDKLDKTNYFVHWVVNDIVENPLLTLRQYSLKFFQSQSFIISPLMKSNKSNLVKWGIHIYINSINYLLVLVSIWSMYILFKRKEYQLFIPFLMFWGWSLVYVFVFHSEQRYMFPARPILIVLFAYGFNEYLIGRSLYKDYTVN